MPVKVRTADEDPLTRAIAPPPDETPEEREVRLQAESEAKKVSDAIDEELNRQRIAEKKAAKPVKVLLLGTLICTPLSILSNLALSPGQSESGMEVSTHLDDTR
jgi:hypothetical protein